MTEVQSAAFSLIQDDLRFLYTVILNLDKINSNFISSLQPYMGVMIDGIEDWVKSFNNSNRTKLQIPTFCKEEQDYYETLRNSIKMWEKNYGEIYDLLKQAYNENEEYFSNQCSTIAKFLKLYDIFGVDRVDGIVCGNTILCYYYNPFYSYGNHGLYIQKMAEIGGEYIVLFDAMKSYKVNNLLVFDTVDYGGLIKSPVGNKFSDKFVLFSILCQINFLIYAIEEWIIEEIPTKLRFLYLMYYSLLFVIPQINNKLKTSFKIDDSWKSRGFRNAIAHYKLGVALNSEDLMFDDFMFGLTQKFFGTSYADTKKAILNELMRLSQQITDYLHL